MESEISSPGASMSPSPRRAWIEIYIRVKPISATRKSPSPRRAWIEIPFYQDQHRTNAVALPTEGVD